MLAMLKTRAERVGLKDKRKQEFCMDGSWGDERVWEHVDGMINDQIRADANECRLLSLMGSGKAVRSTKRINKSKTVRKYKVVQVGDKICKETNKGWIILTPAEKKHWDNLTDVEKHLWSS